MNVKFLSIQKNKQLLATILRLLLGTVFLLSAYTKLIAPGIVEIILVEHGIITTRETAAIVVRLLIGFEFVLGFLFFLNFELRRLVLPASIFFLISFSIYLFYAGYILNDNQNCGCFGETIKMSPLESIIKNIILIGFIGWLYILEKNNKKNILIPIIMTVCSFVFVFIIAPIKPNYDFKFKDFTYFEGKGRVDLSNGNKFILIMNTECEHCQELARQLTSMKRSKEKFPEFFSLLYSEGDISVDSFKVLTGFNFPYHTISINEFFDLIGTSPPRIYWLQDGIIKAKWDSNFVENIDKALSEAR